MKMLPAHYEHIASTVEANMSMVPLSQYTDQGYSAKRYRWDLTYASGLTKWICDTLYPYLNDTHIDTALRHITNTN